MLLIDQDAIESNVSIYSIFCIFEVLLIFYRVKTFKARKADMIVIDQNASIDTSASAYQVGILENELNLEVMNNEIMELLPPKIHENTLEWIIFSDLHVKDSSIETCEQVLQHINDVAVVTTSYF